MGKLIPLPEEPEPPILKDSADADAPKKLMHITATISKHKTLDNVFMFVRLLIC